MSSAGTLPVTRVECLSYLHTLDYSSMDESRDHWLRPLSYCGCISFFFSSRRRHTRFDCDWSSDVCSSDLLERVGNGYILSAARFGDTLVAVRLPDLALGDQPYVGLFVCAHNDSVVERATFRDVRITAPAHEGFVPYRDYIGSNLEILDVAR